jgi:HicA toxin of bacterial toxin-antitoxin,
MPTFGPISRRQLIRALRDLGFEGPITGTGKHPEYMVKGTHQLMLPNPHRGDIRPNLLKRLLDQAGITREEWEAV